MVNISELIPFDVRDNRKENKIQPVFTESYLTPWLSKLPGRKVLDLASGQGIESSFMRELGFRVTSQDLSSSMLRESYFDGNKVLANVGQLPYADNSFDGILLKDAMVFLNPDVRKEMLKSAYRVLDKNSSMLIASETTNLRIWVQDDEGKLPWRESYDSNENWKDILEMCKKAHDFSIYYHTKAQPIAEIATDFGFKPQILTNYSFNDSLGSENRWIKREGFIIELTKESV